MNGATLAVTPAIAGGVAVAPGPIGDLRFPPRKGGDGVSTMDVVQKVLKGFGAKLFKRCRSSAGWPLPADTY